MRSKEMFNFKSKKQKGKVARDFWICAILVIINALLVESQPTFSITSSSGTPSATISYLFANGIKFEFLSGFYKNDSCEFIGSWNKESGVTKEVCLNLCKNKAGCQTYKWHPKESGFCLLSERRYKLDDALAAKSWVCGIRKQAVFPKAPLIPTPTPAAEEEETEESPEETLAFSNSGFFLADPESPSSTPSTAPSITSSESPSVSTSVTPSSSVTVESSIAPSQTPPEKPSTSMSAMSASASSPPIPSKSFITNELGSGISTNKNCYFPKFDYWKSIWGSSFGSCVSACKQTLGCQSLVYQIEWKICSLGRDKYKLTDALSTTSYNCGVVGSSENVPTPSKESTSPSSSVSISAESTPSTSPSSSMPASMSPSSSVSSTPSSTPSTSMTATPSISSSPSSSATASISPSSSMSTSSTPSETPSISVTVTPSGSPTPSEVSSISMSPSKTPTPTPSTTISWSSTPSISLSGTPSPLNMPSVTPAPDVKFEMSNGVYRSEKCFFPEFTFWKTIWGGSWDACGESCKTTGGCNTFVYLVEWKICSMSRLKFKLTDAVSNEVYNCGVSVLSQQ